MGNLIRAARIERGWSKAKLAARAGVHPSYVGRLEKGRYTKPSMENLKAIAEALGRSVMDLLEEAQPTDEEAALLIQVRELTGADDAVFREIMDEVRRYPHDQRAGALRFTLQALRLARTASVQG